LGEIRSMFGEEETNINYLKLDVEGFEILSMPKWTAKDMFGIQQV